MRLIGRNLSPYTRRVAIWMALQGRTFERDEIAMTDPAAWEALGRLHPGRRVPVLLLDDGTRLVETSAICDYLDDTRPNKRLVPSTGEARRDCLQRIAMAHATTEKIVALVYEKNRRPEEFQWPEWQDRLVGQIRGGLSALEDTVGEGFCGGDTPDGSDIAIVCAFQMAEVTNPWVIEGDHAKLRAQCAKAMTLAPFVETHPAP